MKFESRFVYPLQHVRNYLTMPSHNPRARSTWSTSIGFLKEVIAGANAGILSLAVRNSFKFTVVVHAWICNQPISPFLVSTRTTLTKIATNVHQAKAKPLIHSDKTRCTYEYKLDYFICIQKPDKQLIILKKINYTKKRDMVLPCTSSTVPGWHLTKMTSSASWSQLLLLLPMTS